MEELTKEQLKLIESCEKLAHQQAWLKSDMNENINLEDLIFEAREGLVVAARKFDPNKGVKFVTFAHFWINAKINRFIMNNNNTIRVPESAQFKRKKEGANQTPQVFFGLDEGNIDIRVFGKTPDVEKQIHEKELKTILLKFLTKTELNLLADYLGIFGREQLTHREMIEKWNFKNLSASLNKKRKIISKLQKEFMKDENFKNFLTK